MKSKGKPAHLIIMIGMPKPTKGKGKSAGMLPAKSSKLPKKRAK